MDAERTVAGTKALRSVLKRLILTLIAGIVLYPTMTAAQLLSPVAVTGLTVTFNRMAATGKPSFVLYKNSLCLPLRSITSLIGASTTYIRKDDAFELRIPSLNQPVIIAPNSAEIWVGAVQSYFSQSTFFYDGQLYVPFDDFFKAIHFQLLKTPSGYIISSDRATAKPTTTPTASMYSPSTKTMSTGVSVIVSSLPANPKLDAEIPVQPTSQPMSVAFGAKVYPLSGKYMYDGGDLYVDLESILSRQGYAVTHRPNAIVITLGTTTLSWPLTGTDVLVGSGTSTESRGVGRPLIVRQSTVYFPIKGLAALLGYGVEWDATSKRILLLNRIHRIAVVKSGGVMKVMIDATHPVIAQAPMPQDHDGGFSVDVLDAQLACPPGVIDTDNPSVNRLELRQVTNNRVRFKVRVPSSVGYSVVQPIPEGGVMVLSNRVTSVEEQMDGSHWVLTVKGVGHLIPKLWRMPSPSMAVVIDIPNSYSSLPMAIRTLNGAPSPLIRTSQFSLTPAVTRLVFDLPPTQNPTIKPLGNAAFQISLPITNSSMSVTTNESMAHVATGAARIASAAVTTTHNRVVSAGTSHPARIRPAVIQTRSPSRPLYHKIIVIDPGHGGNDPGAIAADGYYEKNLTIDISNRLKAELEAAGAVVIMCRSKDENPSLQDRCDVGNVNNADLFLSVHINSFFHPYAGGTETYYYKPTDKALAYFIHDEMVKTLGFRDNGLKRGRLYVLRNTRMPAMLVEPGFITNPMEYSKFSQADTRQKIAKAIADGTIRYVTDTKSK